MNSVLLNSLTRKHQTSLADKANWEKERKILKERVKQVESGMTMSEQARGRNNLKKENWEGRDYTNDDNINKYYEKNSILSINFFPQDGINIAVTIPELCVAIS